MTLDLAKVGVSRYHRDTDSWNNYKKSDGLIDNEIATIAVDENSVWFGTQDEGVSQYNQVDQAFIKTFTKTDLLKSNMISCIRADGFQVWFGTANAGVHRFIKPVNTWVHYTKADGLASNHVSWVATQGNDVWFASKEDGVSRFDKVTGEWTLYKQADFLADNDVRDITRDVAGNLWMATVAGISIYQPQTRSWEVISKEDGLPTPYVTRIDVVPQLRDSEQSDLIEISTGSVTDTQVWIATDRGLGSRPHAGGEWTFYSPPHSVTHGEAFVTALDADGDILWLGTSSGPAMYDITSQEWMQLRHRAIAQVRLCHPYWSVMRWSGLVGRRVFGDIRLWRRRCIRLPKDFPIRMLMYCFLQMISFGRVRAKGLHDMTLLKVAG